MTAPIARDALRVEHTARSRLPEVDFEHVGFGNVFSDHMFSMRWTDGEWRGPEVLPYGPISLEPGCVALHYGQSVFEGLKVFRGHDGLIRVFRSDRNEARLQASCERLCIPSPPAGTLDLAIDELVTLDHQWIPAGSAQGSASASRGRALYVRPLLFAEESHLEVRPAARYRLLVMTAPVRTYYAGGFSTVALAVQDRYTRAAPGGVGYAKTAGNYAASLLPGDQSREQGFDQALWLDGAEHRYVEEVGQMNIFFVIDGRVVTPALRGSILPGVTRDSVLTLLADRGIQAEERLVEIQEVLDRIADGGLAEAFGAGTAAVIAPVGQIGFQGKRHEINDNSAGPIATLLYDDLLGIQLGERPDTHGWTRVVPLPSLSAAAD